MSDDGNKEKQKCLEHIALAQESSERLDSWLQQIEEKQVHISRKEYLNWIILSLPESIPSSSLNAIVKRYYDPEVHLRRALKNVREAKKNGNSKSIEIIVRPKKTENRRSLEETSQEPTEEQS